MATEGFVHADPPGLRVALAADQNLIAQSVRAALAKRGYDVVAVRWPTVEEGHNGAETPRRRRPRWSADPLPDVGVLLSDLSKITQVRGAQMLLGGLDVSWLVLAGVPAGPAWGALYEGGASLVVATDAGLDTVCGLLNDLYAGRTPDEQEWNHELMRSWRHFARQRGELTVRITSLTGREEEVLRQLDQGLAVRAIADAGAVTESTVRSQVKAILRKLEVNSQMAAVAAYREVNSSASLRIMVPAARPASAES